MYKVIKVFPESGYYNRRKAFEGELVVCEKREHQFTYPRFNPDLPEHLIHAKIKVCTGFWRGQKILLTYFTAEQVEISLCRCKVYQFPHKAGGGKCRS